MAQKTIKSDILSVVKKFGITIKNKFDVSQIILFGSHATGKTHEWIDIDVCIVSPEFGKNLFLEKLTLDRYADKISTKIEPTPMHPKTLQDRYNTLATEIRRYGILIKI